MPAPAPSPPHYPPASAGRSESLCRAKPGIKAWLGKHRRIGLSASRSLCEGAGVARIPLLRTEGKSFDEGYPTLGPAEFAAVTPLLVESRSDKARAAERALGLGDCLYFYAGYAHPGFGDAVLVYEPEWSDAESGSATPFDTGGFHLGYLKVEGVTSETEKKAYVALQRCELSVWRSRLDAYLTKYFASPAAYVRGERPVEDDPTHRLRDARERRAWTWEIRVHGDHDLLDQLRNAYLAADYAEQVREHLRAAVASTRAAEWQERFRAGIVKVADLGDTPHAMAQEEIEACL